MFKILFLLLVFGSYEILEAAPDGNNVNAEKDDGDSSSDKIDLSGYGTAIYGEPSTATGKRLDEWDAASELNPEEVGEYLEGDILIPRDPKLRNGIVGESSRWPNGVVPFEIRGRFNAKNMDLIERALNVYHEKTCIYFVPRTTEHKDYISITSQNTGCWSSVGRVGGEQIINFQLNGCLEKIGTVLHELMHVVGFMHEQNRENRDDYIDIVRNNISPGYEVNFDKAAKGTSNGFGVPYDFNSVMHYSQYAFSKNKRATLEPKKIQSGKINMGQRDGFSSNDIEKINRMYKCKRTASSDGHKADMSGFKAVMHAIFGV